MKTMFLDTRVEDVELIEDGEDIDDGAEFYGGAEEYYNEDVDAEESSFWPEELAVFESGELESFVDDDYYPERLSGNDWDVLDDSEEVGEALREVLSEDYEDATPEEIQEAFSNILSTMTPAEGFNFKKALKGIAKVGRKILRDPTVGQIAKTVLPVAGATLGSVISPGVGTAVGGKLGQAAAQAFSPRGKARTRPVARKLGGASAQGGSAAAAQLVQLTQNPDMLKSLLALALGSHGKSAIGVGKAGLSVPVGGFVNLLSTLASKAAADADELLRETGEKSDYLLEGEEGFRVDPAVPEDRAKALYETLISAENEQAVTEAAFYSEYPEFADELRSSDYDRETLEDILY